MTVSPWVKHVLIIPALVLWLAACSGVQVDSTPIERFAAGNYQTYSWRAAPIENTDGSSDPMYLLDPAIRRAVDKHLMDKGYQRVADGGDFLIDYQFKASFADGSLNSTAAMQDNVYVGTTAGAAVINRRTDQALVDNAYALSGPREMNSVLLSFSDGADQGLVWAASMSKIVENLNRTDEAKMAKSLEAAMQHSLSKIPPAN